MWKTLTVFFSVIFLFLGSSGNSQGSWMPSGMDNTFPRTLLDSVSVDTVRQTLDDGEINELFQHVWNNATGAIPPGNSADIDRINRALQAKEAAFVYLMDKKPVPGGVVSLSAVERDTLLNRVVYLLGQLNTDVNTGSGLTFYNPWQFRSKELIAALIAYDLLRGAGISDATLGSARSKLITFAGNLYQKAMASYVFGFFTFFTYQFNNHSIMTASALGLAAVVLNDHSSSNPNQQPQNWFNVGLYHLDNTLWMENGTYPRVSEPDTLAGYAEGPHYLRYGFENAFPFLRAMGNILPDGYHQVSYGSTTRTIRNPWFDPRYDRLYDWMNRIRMPDGSCPPIHDSYLAFGTKITSLSGKSQFNLPNPGFSANDPFVRCQYIATNVAQGTFTDSLFQSLPAAGSLVFRSSWESDALCMHFIGKHGIALAGAKSHHQADASSFSLWAYGQLLALDPGFPGASLASAVNKATDHNLVLVDNGGPLPPTGEQVSTSTNNAWIEHCFDTPWLDYGEVRTGYSGCTITRRNLFIRNRYFILGDFIVSPATKSFTFQLHGNGLFGAASDSITGSWVPQFGQHGGVWTRDTVSLLAKIITPGQDTEYSWVNDSMAIDNGFRHYSKLLVHKNLVPGTFFLSALVPFCNTPLQVESIFPAGNGAAFRIYSGEGTDLVFCRNGGVKIVLPADSTGLGKSVEGNGRINLYSETPDGSLSMAFIQEGDTLKAGSDYLFLAGQPIDLCWETTSPGLIQGYVSDECVVTVHADSALHVIRGPVSGIVFDSSACSASLTFSGSGNFLLASSDRAWVWHGSQGSDWHNPLNWTLEGYPAIHGIPTDLGDVVIPGEASTMPVIQPLHTAHCRNLTVEPGATLTVGINAGLVVSGNTRLKY